MNSKMGSSLTIGAHDGGGWNMVASIISGLEKLDGILGRLERVLAYCASGAFAAVLLVVSLDTILRQTIGISLYWGIDVVARYLMPAGFYLAIAFSFRSDDHIRMVAFRERLSGKLSALVDFLIYLASCAVFFTIAVRTLSRSYGQWLSGEVFVGVYFWPNWISTFLVGLGCLVLSLSLLVRALLRLSSIPSGASDPYVVTGQEGEGL